LKSRNQGLTAESVSKAEHMWTKAAVFSPRMAGIGKKHKGSQTEATHPILRHTRNNSLQGEAW